MSNLNEEASERMSLFLETVFTASQATGVSLGVYKGNKLVVVDQETGKCKSFEPEELQSLFIDWVRRNNNG